MGARRGRTIKALLLLASAAGTLTLSGCSLEADCESLSERYEPIMSAEAERLSELGASSEFICDSDGSGKPVWIYFTSEPGIEASAVQVTVEKEGWTADGRDGIWTFYTRRVGEEALRLTVAEFHNGEIGVSISPE